MMEMSSIIDYLEFVIEVGPGPGGITRKLFEHGAGKVAAIEKDIRLFPALQVKKWDPSNGMNECLVLDISECGWFTAPTLSRWYPGF